MVCLPYAQKVNNASAAFAVDVIRPLTLAVQVSSALMIAPPDKAIDVDHATLKLKQTNALKASVLALQRCLAKGDAKSVVRLGQLEAMAA